MIIISESGESYRLDPPRNEGFTHSHTDASFGGGFHCTYDVLLDRDRMKASISCGGEAFEFSIKEIIE